MVDVQEIIDSNRFQHACAQLDEDAEDAMDLMDKNLKNGQIKSLPNDLIKQYKADRKLLEKHQSAWDDELDRAYEGKTKKYKKLRDAQSKYVLALCALDEQNNRVSALLDANIAQLAGEFAKLVEALVKATQKRAENLVKELAEIKKALEKAEKDVTEAKVQMALGVAVTAVTACLGPAGLAARLGVAAGSIAAHTIIDYSLGPSGASAGDTAATVSEEALNASNKVSGTVKGLSRAAGALITVSLDGQEINQAYKNVYTIGKRLEKAEKEYQLLALRLAGAAPLLVGLNKTMQTAAKTIKSRTSTYKASTREYEAIKKELKKLK